MPLFAFITSLYVYGKMSLGDNCSQMPNFISNKLFLNTPLYLKQSPEIHFHKKKLANNCDLGTEMVTLNLSVEQKSALGLERPFLCSGDLGFFN